MIAPTGRDIVLEAHGSRAEIGTIAAVLRSLAIDGLQVTEPTRLGETPAFSNGTILAPWPNRVRDARWRFDGAEQQLARMSFHGGHREMRDAVISNDLRILNEVRNHAQA